MQTPKISRPKIKISSIEEAFHRLLIGGSFYAIVAAGLRRRPVPAKICETIGVVCNNEADLGIELIYNPEFIESIQDFDFLEFVIEHECVHLLMKHLERYYSDTRLAGIPQEVFNVAADMAVNTMITKHYERLLKDHRDQIHMPEDWEMRPEMAMEAYAQILDAKVKARQAEIEAKSTLPATSGSLDSLLKKHGVNPHLWGHKLEVDSQGNHTLVPITPGDAQNSEVKQEANLGEYVERCVQSFKTQGELPAYVKELVKDFVKLDKDIHWGEILKSRIKSGMRGVSTRTMMRPSRRRHGLPPEISRFPGVKLDHTYKVCLAIDTSGSMSYDDLATAKEVLNDLLNHYKNSVKVFVVYADTQVSKVQEIKSMVEFDMEITGRGGTDFVAPIAYIEKEIKPDILAYFTDGYGEAPYKAPRAKMLWFISQNGKNPTKDLPEPYGEEINVGKTRRVPV